MSSPCLDVRLFGGASSCCDLCTYDGDGDAPCPSSSSSCGAGAPRRTALGRRRPRRRWKAKQQSRGGHRRTTRAPSSTLLMMLAAAMVGPSPFSMPGQMRFAAPSVAAAALTPSSNVVLGRGAGSCCSSGRIAVERRRSSPSCLTGEGGGVELHLFFRDGGGGAAASSAPASPKEGTAAAGWWKRWRPGYALRSRGGGGSERAAHSTADDADDGEKEASSLSSRVVTISRKSRGAAAPANTNLSLLEFRSDGPDPNLFVEDPFAVAVEPLLLPRTTLLLDDDGTAAVPQERQQPALKKERQKRRWSIRRKSQAEKTRAMTSPSPLASEAPATRSVFRTAVKAQVETQGGIGGTNKQEAIQDHENGDATAFSSDDSDSRNSRLPQGDVAGDVIQKDGEEETKKKKKKRAFLNFLRLSRLGRLGRRRTAKKNQKTRSKKKTDKKSSSAQASAGKGADSSSTSSSSSSGRLAKATSQIFENVVTNFVTNQSLYPPHKLSVTSTPRGDVSVLRRLLTTGRTKSDISITFERIAFPPIRISGGGRIDIVGLNVNVLPYMPKPLGNVVWSDAKPFGNPFDFHVRDCVWTQDDLLRSPCVKNGLESLLRRILNRLDFVQTPEVTVRSVKILPNTEKISIKGLVTTFYGTKMPFEVRSGIVVSGRGHVLSFPGLEIALNPAFQAFVPVVPELDVDLGHNANVERLDIDGKRRNMKISMKVRVNPLDDEPKLEYRQRAEAYLAQFSVDAGKFFSGLCNFPRLNQRA